MAKILVVEDDESIRYIMFRFVSGEGHEVLEAGTVSEAIDLLKENEDIAGVFSDYNLGYRTGIEIYEWIQENRPELKMVFCSASSDPMPALKLLKPMRREDIRWVLKELMNL